MEVQVYGYVRVSTDEQAKEGVSLAAQTEQIKAYCVFKGLPEPRILSEEGISGGMSLEKRPVGKNLPGLKHAIVIVCKLDRLFRNSMDCQTCLHHWEKQQTTVHILNMGGNSLDTQSAIGKLFIQLMAGMAEFERNLIAERTKDALGHMRASGKRTTTIAPYGYEFIPDGEYDYLVPIPAQIAFIEEIKFMRAQGLTFQAIAKALTTKGVPTPKGGRWTPMSIKRICERKQEKTKVDPVTQLHARLMSGMAQYVDDLGIQKSV